MKKKLSLLILAICVVTGFLFVSCEKETTETNMIIRNWNLVSKNVGALNVTTDCELGAKWNFKADGTYVIKDVCDNVETGTWLLAADGKTLTLDGAKAYKVVENTLLKLVIELQVNDVGLVRWSFN